MSEDRLRELLRATPLPGAAEAEARGSALIAAAFADREPPRRRSPLPRLALVTALVTMLGALLLSPAGAAVRGWIGGVFEAGVRNAEPALTRIPGGGRLAVTARQGPWVVKPDGSRRLLGHYREATWSPHGLYLAAVSGRTLTALEPDGTPRWSLTAPAGVRDARWSPSGYRIAYLAGGALWTVAGDGTGPRPLARRVPPVAPAWSPLAPEEERLAYLDRRGRLVVRDTDSGAMLAAAPALPHLAKLEWAGAGRLLEASARAVRLRRVEPRPGGGERIGAPHRLRLPGGGRLRRAALSPDGRTVALLAEGGPAAAPRAQIDLLDPSTGRARRLFTAPGRLGEVVFAPDSQRLLVSWPQADQWLFLPTSGRGRVDAVASIAAAFAPGGRRAGPFPAVSGWCCAADLAR